jgi:hypothetical protein
VGDSVEAGVEARIGRRCIFIYELLDFVKFPFRHAEAVYVESYLCFI